MTPAGAGDLRLTVVVVSVGRPEALRRCLEAIAAQDEPPDQLVVGLRRDDRASRSAVEPLGDAVTLVLVDRPGQVAALNAATARATGDVVAIVDDDARPHADWVRSLRRRYRTDPRIGAVGGRDVVFRDGVPVDGWAPRVGYVTWWGRLVGRHHERSPLQDVAFLKGANMSFRAAALEPFDERLRGAGAQVCNDLAATLSVRRRGWRVVYDPAVVVDHHPAPRLGEDQRDARSLAAECDEQHNELYVLLRHRPGWQAPLLVAYRVLVGYRHAPGLALGLLAAVRAPRSLRRTLALTRARLSALPTAVAARRAPR